MSNCPKKAENKQANVSFEAFLVGKLKQPIIAKLNRYKNPNAEAGLVSFIF